MHGACGLRIADIQDAVSYYNFRYGGSFTYATAYDPAFYNIIISGDQVWVEPSTSLRCSGHGADRFM